MKKYLMIVIMVLLLIPGVMANICGGTLPGGTSVTSPDSCASCHVKVVPIYKSVWGKLTKDVIGKDVQCAGEFGLFLDKMWLNDAEFSEQYPSGQAVENALEDIARERANIELEKLMYQEKKKNIKEANLIAWGLNVAIIKLVIELLRIVIYIIELWFLIYFMLNIIPNFFFKIRDSVVDLYIRKRGR